MFESFGFEETTAKEASVLLAALIGLAFGVLAQRTRFCFRRSLVGEDRRQALGVWLTALALAGLPTDKFFFNGFLPNASGQRKTALRALKDVPGTLVFYESPKRVAAMLRDAGEVLGGTRQAAVCRELTKKFEEVLNGDLDTLALVCGERSLKGEIVVLIDRAGLINISESDLEVAVMNALETMTVRDAADAVSTELGMPRRQVYQLALKLDAQTNDD